MSSQWSDDNVKRLLDAAEAVWKAYTVVVSNGPGAWTRHVEPAICDLKRVVGEFRPSKKVYAAGYYSADSWGMFDGPTPDIDSLLCSVPDKDSSGRKAYILEFAGDEEYAVKVWNEERDRWEDY